MCKCSNCASRSCVCNRASANDSVRLRRKRRRDEEARREEGGGEEKGGGGGEGGGVRRGGTTTTTTKRTIPSASMYDLAFSDFCQNL